MPYAFPYNSHYTRHHHIEEENLYNDSDALDVVPIHVNRRYSPYNGTGRYKQHPIPLPSPPYSSESLLLR